MSQEAEDIIARVKRCDDRLAQAYEEEGRGLSEREAAAMIGLVLARQMAIFFIAIAKAAGNEEALRHIKFLLDNFSEDLEEQEFHSVRRLRIEIHEEAPL